MLTMEISFLFFALGVSHQMAVTGTAIFGTVVIVPVSSDVSPTEVAGLILPGGSSRNQQYRKFHRIALDPQWTWTDGQ